MLDVHIFFTVLHILCQAMSYREGYLRYTIYASVVLIFRQTYVLLEEPGKLMQQLREIDSEMTEEQINDILYNVLSTFNGLFVLVLHQNIILLFTKKYHAPLFFILSCFNVSAFWVRLVGWDVINGLGLV